MDYQKANEVLGDMREWLQEARDMERLKRLAAMGDTQAKRELEKARERGRAEVFADLLEAEMKKFKASGFSVDIVQGYRGKKRAASTSAWVSIIPRIGRVDVDYYPQKNELRLLRWGATIPNSFPKSVWTKAGWTVNNPYGSSRPAGPIYADGSIRISGIQTKRAAVKAARKNLEKLAKAVGT